MKKKWWFVFMVLFLMGLAGNYAPANGAEGSNPDQEQIVFYDMTPAYSMNLNDENQRRRFYDETLLVVSLQGLVNRDRPRLYLRYNAEPDDFWWRKMREKGGWMENAAVETLSSATELLNRFSSFYQGAVIWDERVPATSNLAVTIAGSEDLLCIRYDTSEDSVYHDFVLQGPKIKPVVRLQSEDGSPMFTGQGTLPDCGEPSTGSAKNDAYLWLIEHSLKTGKTNPHLLGYYLDSFWLRCWFASSPQNHTLTNLDYLVANRGFVFDLNVWDDETPVDDPGQKPGTDVLTLKKILRVAYDRFGGDGMIQVPGFTPWAFKYTDYKSDRWNAGGQHGGVPTEWRYAEILSCYNAFMDADALGTSSMANASFFQHFPLPDCIPQNPKPTRESLKKEGILDEQGAIIPRQYVAHYVGDYDSAAWLYWKLPQMWTDENRGKVPLSWAFNPNLSNRFPLGMFWSRQTRTVNDFFVAGDSGAGYLNPGNLSEPRVHSGLPSGMAAWETHCRRLFRQWDISLTGFVIDGYAPGLSEEGLDAYSRFSPDGIVPQKIPPQGVHKNMPYIRMNYDLGGDPAEAARVMQSRFLPDTPSFYVFRSILQTPSWYVKLGEALETNTEGRAKVVDLYTLLWLVRETELQKGVQP